MKNSGRLDVVGTSEVEDTITNLMARGLLGGAPTPVAPLEVDASVLDHAASDAVEGVETGSTEAMARGGTIISGPAEGGTLLDRPVGTFLAEQAEENSLSIERFGSELDPTYLAQRITSAGETEIAGMEVNVIDFVPGGDMVQMVAGERFNPTSVLMAIAKGKIESDLIHGHVIGREREAEDAGTGSRDGSGSPADDLRDPQSASSSSLRHPKPPANEKVDDLSSDVPDASRDHSSDRPEGEATSDAPHDETPPVASGVRRPKIDQDTAARDMAILGAEHARNLDNAVSQWDEQDVRTEMTLHGRRLEVDTHFDATNPDNREERKAAENHAKDLPLIETGKETVTEGNRMAFRSQVHAHLEAASRDEGISR